MKPDKIREQLMEALSCSVSISDSVLIYGAGKSSSIAAECFKKEYLPITHFVDRDPAKIGTLFQGKPVISPEEMLAQHKDKTVLISTINKETYRCIKKELDDMGVNSVWVDTYVFTKNRNKVLEVYDLLCDDISRSTYANMIMARMDFAEMDLSLISPNGYFAVNEFSLYSESEVFVDCGAYVGDTIERYLSVKSGIFGKIFAFEPEKRNYAAMEYRIERLKREWALSDKKVTLIRGGVDSISGSAFISDEDGDMASIDAFVSENCSGTEIPVYALDDYFQDQPISFLKADIEGYEERMLLGARKVILRDRPKIAVCIYHNASDMYRIPLLLSELYSGYRFSVRQHYGNIAETVLYAY